MVREVELAAARDPPRPPWLVARIGPEIIETLIDAQFDLFLQASWLLPSLPSQPGPGICACRCCTELPGRQRRVRPHVPLTCGFATPLPAPSLCSRPRYPASPVPSGAPCHLVARATPRSAQNRGRVFLCSDPNRLSRFGHHEASCAPRRARIPTQRLVFDLAPPRNHPIG